MKKLFLLFTPLLLLISCKDNSVDPLVDNVNEFKITRIEITAENIKCKLDIETSDHTSPLNPKDTHDTATKNLSYHIYTNVDEGFVKRDANAYDYNKIDSICDFPGSHSIYIKFNDSKSEIESFKYEYAKSKDSADGVFTYRIFSMFFISHTSIKPIVSNDSVMIFDLAPSCGYTNLNDIGLHNVFEKSYRSDTLGYTNRKSEFYKNKSNQNSNVVYRVKLYLK